MRERARERQKGEEKKVMPTLYASAISTNFVCAAVLSFSLECLQSRMRGQTVTHKAKKKDSSKTGRVRVEKKSVIVKTEKTSAVNSNLWLLCEQEGRSTCLDGTALPSS